MRLKYSIYFHFYYYDYYHKFQSFFWTFNSYQKNWISAETQLKMKVHHEIQNNNKKYFFINLHWKSLIIYELWTCLIIIHFCSIKMNLFVYKIQFCICVICNHFKFCLSYNIACFRNIFLGKYSQQREKKKIAKAIRVHMGFNCKEWMM